MAPKVLSRIVILAFILSLCFTVTPAPVLAASISKNKNQEQSGMMDVLSFMLPSYNINGLTPLNSFMGLRSHIWDNTNKVWINNVEDMTCPYDQCATTDWRSRAQTRQIAPGLFYLSKNYFPGKSDEVFFYNSSSIYDFGEAYSVDRSDYTDPAVFGLFHNFYDPSDADFPNRGYFWSARYYPAAPVTLYNVKIWDFRNNQYQRKWDGSAKVVSTLEYIPKYSDDIGNLPGPLEVIVNTQTNYDAASNITFIEKYFYAKSFGLIRYERWEGGILINYNSYNIITPYPTGENPNSYFHSSFYADPRLEPWPGEPSNGAQSRGRILTSSGWLQLTSILTDGDWMLASSCPDGYKSYGKVNGQYVDYRSQAGQGEVSICGTNADVQLIATCPTGYIARGQIGTLNYCVDQSEILPQGKYFIYLPVVVRPTGT